MKKPLEHLRPTDRPRLIDLVRDAGIDVDDWARYKGGASRAAANPKYCYEWAFLSPGQVVVLSVWHAQLRTKLGEITIEDNLRDTANFYRKVPNKTMWTKRAESFDRAVAAAAEDSLPVRTIICDGEMRAKFDRHARASRVHARLLDSAPWAVTSYEPRTGQFVLRRGALPHRLKDQFSIDEAPSAPTEIRNAAGIAFVRSAAIRSQALKRADGRCEWCSEQGFTMDDGSIFLETHHVVPLSEGGPDVLANVVALCPTHHREAHLGSSRHSMRQGLLERAKRRS